MEFLGSFDLIISGLDSIPPRRWINAAIHSLAMFHEDGSLDESSLIPLIDGGTEGFKGSVRVIFPFKSACLECTLDLYPSASRFPICTVSGNPRLPEHCISWAFLIKWPQCHSSLKFDPDKTDHFEWLVEAAIERSNSFKINGVTRDLCLQIVKNIIPAISSTNALIAAICCQEAIKIFSKKQSTNFLLFNGSTSIYSGNFSLERNSDCLVCASIQKIVDFEGKKSLEDLLNFFISSNQFK